MGIIAGRAAMSQLGLIRLIILGNLPIKDS